MPMFLIIQALLYYLQQQFYIYMLKAIIDYIEMSFSLWKPQIFNLLLYSCAAYNT